MTYFLKSIITIIGIITIYNNIKLRNIINTFELNNVDDNDGYLNTGEEDIRGDGLPKLESVDASEDDDGVGAEDGENAHEEDTGEEGTGKEGTGEEGTGEKGTGEEGTGEEGTGEKGTGEEEYILY